jgi:beta-lactamase class A
MRIVPWVVFGATAVMASALGPRSQSQQEVAAIQAPAAGLVFPAPDPALQAGLRRVLNERPFRTLVRKHQLSVVLVDLSDSSGMRYAGVDDDVMRYAASLPKIAIMLGVFDQVDRGNLAYTPELRAQLEDMIRRSDNPTATELIRLVGFENIARALQDPRYELYDPDRQGGLWVGKDYGGDLGYWQRDPIHDISHGATARQVARFMVMVDRGTLVSPWASAEMKDIMGHPAIHHKFVLGLDARPGSVIYRKSGTWRTWHADAAIVERDGKKYVAVALLESTTTGVLSQLIVRLDDLIHAPQRRTRGD